MANIRHVAFMIKDPKKVRDFYEGAFGFEECYSSASGAFMVMDGLFNLALLPIRAGESEVVGTHRTDGGEANQTPGINHFGFLVDSVDETLNRLDPNLKHGQNPQDGRPAEMRVFDPWGNGFDLSARGYFGREEKRLPAVRRVVFQADRPNEVGDFYRTNLDLADEGQAADGSIYLGDGHIHMAIMQEGLTPKTGIQYIGIQVDDWDAMVERFAAVGQRLTKPEKPDEDVVVRDPEGNVLVLSERGWDS